MIFPRISIFINIGFLMVCLFSHSLRQAVTAYRRAAKRQGYTLTVLFEMKE
ncbi:hypothetical protein M077_1568 [Bacteroides fragilis str. 2-F-2 |nr:hypothetical protein M077_1568 [Bacteroides fragilis str. 2-F-2 \